ncbi:DUF2200 domain-containing protein [Candidatus Peribacteria bacterium]|nr:DUF2200 domain-containing protein [Candidatus Peribacteria bacterium]
MDSTTPHRVFRMAFSSLYACYTQKVTKKYRSTEELDTVICWLTGYSREALATLRESDTDLQTFFAEAPQMHPARVLITGKICGVQIDAIEDPTMRSIRYLDKLVDELAKGRPLEKILRKS